MVNVTILASGYTTVMSAFNFNTATNKLSLLTTTPTENSPSWLEVGPTPGTLFAALEIEKGGLESFTIGKDGSLTSVSQVQTQGIPVHFALLEGGKEIVTANYDTGLVVSCAVEDDGVTLGKCTDGATLTGSGAVAGRQDSPHAHQIVQYNDEILISDLGTDNVWRLAKDTDGSWQVAGAVAQAPGSGPRHIVAHNDVLYVLHELDNSLSAYTLPHVGLTPQPEPEPETPEVPTTPEEPAPEEPSTPAGEPSTPAPEEPASTPSSAKFRFRRSCTTKPTPPATPAPEPTGEPAPETPAPEEPAPEVPTPETPTPETPTPEQPETPAPQDPETPLPPLGDEPQLLGNFSVLPPNPVAGSTWGAGELLLSKDGKYLYASNRNVGTTDKQGDPIAIFTTEPFALVEHYFTGLTHVRGMVFGGENDEYLIVAGQNEGGVKMLARSEDGKLSELDHYTGEGSEKITTFAWSK